MRKLDQNERQALIRRSFLFKDVGDGVLDRLANLSVTKQLDRRETLFNRGDEGDALYAVIEGLVRIWVGSDSGKELTFSIMEPGDVFGEIALLDGLPRTANATAQETTQLLVIQRSAFLSVLGNDAQLGRHIIELLCERLRLKTDLLSDFAFAELPVRLARKLNDLSISTWSPPMPRSTAIPRGWASASRRPNWRRCWACRARRSTSSSRPGATRASSAPKRAG